MGGMIGWFGSMLRATRKNSISGATTGFQPLSRYSCTTRFSTLRGAMGMGLPCWSVASWMTWMVQSAVQGAAVAVE